jgi:hypothetical protein
MKLTEKEQKIARLALDKGAKDGERQAAAAKLIDSLYACGVTVEDIENESVLVEYDDHLDTETVYRNRPAPPPTAPGDIFEGVTVDNLRQPGYSKRAKDVPAELEREIYAWHGIRDHTGFVIDHLVPVELAGRSTLANLWPLRVEDAKRKDRLSAKLHELVLSGRLELGAAQREIASNWIEAYKKYVSP